MHELKPAYEPKSVKSDTKSVPEKNRPIPETIDTWEYIFKSFGEKEASAVVWYYDKIMFYQLSGSVFDYDTRVVEEIVRLRIFNKNRELHIWRSNGTLTGRLRTDNDTVTDVEYIRAVQIMNGSAPFNIDESGKLLLAKEERGSYYELPFTDLIEVVKKSNNKPVKKLVLVTRNYIGYNEVTHQAGYVDCRFESIEVLKKQVL